MSWASGGKWRCRHAVFCRSPSVSLCLLPTTQYGVRRIFPPLSTEHPLLSSLYPATLSFATTVPLSRPSTTPPSFVRCSAVSLVLFHPTAPWISRPPLRVYTSPWHYSGRDCVALRTVIAPAWNDKYARKRRRGRPERTKREAERTQRHRKDGTSLSAAPICNREMLVPFVLLHTSYM